MKNTINIIPPITSKASFLAERGFTTTVLEKASFLAFMEPDSVNFENFVLYRKWDKKPVMVRAISQNAPR